MCKVIKCIVLIIFATHRADCGLLTGDLKLKSKPLTINSHHAPINIHINTNKLKAALPSLSLPKPAKPPPKALTDLLKPSLLSAPKLPLNSKLSDLLQPPLLSKSILPSSRKSLFPSLSKSIFPPKSIFPSKTVFNTRKLPRSSILSKPGPPSLDIPELPKLPSLSKPKLSPLSKLSVPIVPPLMPIIPPALPKVPLLPLPLIPPVIPPFPLLPILPPIVPGIPLVPIVNPLKPLRVPILGGKSPLQKALGSEIKPVLVDIKEEMKKDMMERKLRNLLKRGSLTTAEFNRFRRLLVG